MARHAAAHRAIGRFARALTAGAVCALAVGGLRAAQVPTPTVSAKPGTGTALVLGQIIDAAGGGVTGAIVTLDGGLLQAGGFNTNLYPAPVAGGPRRTITNAEGFFVFSELPKGTYSIGVSRTGYAPGAYGRQRPGGIAQSFDVADGERLGPMKITVWKYAAISGRLIDDAGEPLTGAIVSCYRRSYESGRQRFTSSGSGSADDRGVYRIASLTPGEYIVSVQSSRSTTPAETVDAYAKAVAAGRQGDFIRELGGIGQAIGTTGVRVGNFVVQTGNSYLSSGLVPPQPDENGRMLSFRTTYYAAASTLAEAEVLTLASGEERAGTDFQLQLVPTASVSGAVVGPDGPVPNISLRLVAGFTNNFTSDQEVATSVSDAAGRFTFLGVPIGAYVLSALKVPLPPPPSPPTIVSGSVLTMPPAPPLPQGPTLWAELPLTVDEAGVSNLTLKLGGGFHISGRFQFDGSGPKPPPNIVETLDLVIQPIDGRSRAVGDSQVAPDGTITTTEIPPGKYSIRMAAPTPSWEAMKGWTFVSSVIDGVDVASTPLNLQSDVSGLVITMSDHPSEITGMVRDGQGRVDPHAAVLIFSANRARWSDFGTSPRQLRNLRPAKDGTYRVLGLPPGSYFVAAVPDAQATDWQDVRFLDLVARSATVLTINEGERKVQDVVTRSVR